MSKKNTCIESFNCWFTDLSTTTTYREHFCWWDRYNSSDSTVFSSSYFIGFNGLMWCDVQVQEKLRLDLRRKIEALDIDQTCFSLDNRSLLCPIYFTIGCSGSVANMFVANCTLYQSSYDLLCTLIKIHVSNVFFPSSHEIQLHPGVHQADLCSSDPQVRFSHVGANKVTPSHRLGLNSPTRT